ncbi:MAG TPA: hypothetical protein VLC79_08930 [Cellvibrio sp.]|nr:hypothetical protein [Cellvibrio sp.]
MSDYVHHVSGFFAHRDQALEVSNKLVESGIAQARIHVLDKTTPFPPHEATADSNGVLKDMLVDGAIGTVVGTGVGALTQIALVTANVSLFVASPLIAPLMLLGWGASLGGFLGAAVGASKKPKPFADLVKDAISNDQYVVIIETLTPEETDIATGIIKDAVGDYTDTAQA